MILDGLSALQARAYVPTGMKGWSGDDIGSFVAQPTGQLWIAHEKNGELCGFLLIQRVDTEVEILAIAVDPAFQRRMIAFRLVEKAVLDDEGAKTNRIILEVASTNHAALCLYEMLNFRKIGKRRDYYRIGCKRVDATLMERVLV